MVSQWGAPRKVEFVTAPSRPASQSSPCCLLMHGIRANRTPFTRACDARGPAYNDAANHGCTHQLNLLQVSCSQAGCHRPDLPRPNVALCCSDIIRIFGFKLAVPIKQPATLVTRVDGEVVVCVKTREIQSNKSPHNDLRSEGLLVEVTFREKLIRRNRATDGSDAGHRCALLRNSLTYRIQMKGTSRSRA